MIGYASAATLGLRASTLVTRDGSGRGDERCRTNRRHELILVRRDQAFDAIVETATLAESYSRSTQAAFRGDQLTVEVHLKQLRLVLHVDDPNLQGLARRLAGFRMAPRLTREVERRATPPKYFWGRAVAKTETRAAIVQISDPARRS